MADVQTILNVKLSETGDWIPIPAIKGTSVTIEDISSSTAYDTTGSSMGIYEYGVTLKDESTNATNTIKVSSVLATAIATTTTITRYGTTATRSGVILTLFDGYTASQNTNYVPAVVSLWDGLEGTLVGSVQSVDGVGLQEDSTNIQIDAVSYASQSLSSSQASQARANINAQIFGDYIISPPSKISNQFLKYIGNDVWITEDISVQAFPTEGIQHSLLMKSYTETNDVEWVAPLSSSDIDLIFVE